MLNSYILACGGSSGAEISIYKIQIDKNFIDEALLKEDIKNPMYYYSNIKSRTYINRKEYFLKIKSTLEDKELDKILNNFKDKNIQSSFFKYRDVIYKTPSYHGNLNNNLKILKDSYENEMIAFFKLRYAHMMCSVYHNLHRYKDEIKFIDSLDRNLLKNSIVWEWIDSFYAGALRHEKQYVKAAYLFSKVFSTHISDSYVGYYDFLIKTDEQWNELLKMAQNDEEKIVFHFLRSINPKNNKLEELKLMTSINKDSIWVKRLLFTISQNIQEIINYNDTKEESKNKIINDFMQYLSEYKSTNELGDFLYGYFMQLQTKKLSTIESVKYQKLLDYLYYISNIKKLNEKEISTKLQNILEVFKTSNINKNLKLITMDKLSTLYEEYSLKQELAYFYRDHYQYDFRMRYINIDDMNNLLKLKNKPNKTYIENLLITSPAVKIEKDYIVLIKSIDHTQKFEFKKALAFAKQLPDVKQNFSDVYDWGKKNRKRASRENPFKIDYHRGFYTQIEFLNTMIKLKEVLKVKPNSATDNFLYANGLYNMSFYGNSSMLGIMYKSSTAIIGNYIQSILEAKKYYNNALKNTNDDEFKAKILYQLMKIDLIETMDEIGAYKEDSYNYRSKYYDYINYKKFVKPLIEHSTSYQQHYYDLQEYKKTKYYNSIKQCVSFEYFK